MPRWFTNRGITRHGIVKGSLSLSLSLLASNLRQRFALIASLHFRAAVPRALYHSGSFVCSYLHSVLDRLFFYRSA